MYASAYATPPVMCVDAAGNDAWCMIRACSAHTRHLYYVARVLVVLDGQPDRDLASATLVTAGDTQVTEAEAKYTHVRAYIYAY